MLGNFAGHGTVTMKKMDNLLLGLKLILTKELTPIREQLAALRVENQVLRDALKDLRKARGEKASAPATVDDVVRRYDALN